MGGPAERRFDFHGMVFTAWFALLVSQPALVGMGRTDLFLVSLAIWDLKTRGKLHSVTLWAGLLLIVSQPLRLWLSGTQAWLQFMSRVL